MRAVVGVPAEALRVNKQHVRKAMKGVVDSLMIVSEPFAVAYGLEALLHTLIIDIGAGTTDFCVMNGRYPTEDDQRTLTKAGDSVDEQLAQADARAPPARPVLASTWCAAGRRSTASSARRRSRSSSPRRSHGKPTQIDITEEMRLGLREPAAAVLETMLDLLAAVEPEYQERVRQNVILSGGGSRDPRPRRPRSRRRSRRSAAAR